MTFPLTFLGCLQVLTLSDTPAGYKTIMNSTIFIRAEQRGIVQRDWCRLQAGLVWCQVSSHSGPVQSDLRLMREC